ncbi:origin recognition complex subunit 3 [Cephus cinctus]|uniref:Origin recognition complex subunit 3 n=1 Tax=Cephus cinctus TaxID=211228 RepID=A0AAJ7CBN5_CEPCN|nr:origin recognition complex subunit 3 [Cephus cinctus]
MDNVSVSKGVFSYKGSYKIGQKRKKAVHAFQDEPWYIAYKQTWSTIQKAAEAINSNMFKQILLDLHSYVSNMDYDTIDGESYNIPTAILLTGVNLPDHEILFQKLTARFKTITPHIAIIQSRDSSNLKNVMEETVYQLINGDNKNKTQKVRKNQCTFRALKLWYKESCDPDTPLIIIFPDFERIPARVLRDFILILSVYIKEVKFVLIFGVATTLHAVHRALTYDVTSKLQVKVFRTQTQMKSLSDILEGTALSGNVPFKLTGRAFQLLIDIFLFYDFSVDGFLQGYKLCMMQHFYGNNVNALCCQRENVKKVLSGLNLEDLEKIREIPSIVEYIKNTRKHKETRRPTNRELMDVTAKLIKEFHDKIGIFLTLLKCLHVLVRALPGAPLGKQLRELYGTAVTTTLTETTEYKECLQLLGFLSKGDFLTMLETIEEIIDENVDTVPEDFQEKLKNHINTIRHASLEIVEGPTEILSADQKLNRAQLRQKLLLMSQKHSRSPFKQAQLDLIVYLDREVFSVYLKNPSQLPANEIFCYSDGTVAKCHIRGSLRASIHTALNNPQVYLECTCCNLENDEAILPCLPDLSIVYKLHLESRKLINMYDWLQAFLTIVNPNEEAEEQQEVDAQVQARFTRAVAELQFMGFIKSSRRKTDHVKRLT